LTLWPVKRYWGKPYPTGKPTLAKMGQVVVEAVFRQTTINTSIKWIIISNCLLPIRLARAREGRQPRTIS
jgi:hypothetical protein